MKKALIIVAAVIALLLFVGFPMYVHFGNNAVAADVAARLEKLPVPPDTDIVETASAAGKFTGNGNGMQYLGAMLVSSTLSREQLSEYYSSLSENNGFDVYVQEQDGAELSFDRSALTYKRFDESKKEVCYTVYAYGSSNGYFLGELLYDFDIRGH